MTYNQYEFMIRTGKYYPDDNIQYDYHPDVCFFERLDENGKSTYYEESSGYWYKHLYNVNGDSTYFENSDGYWERTTYESDYVYHEDSDGYWNKKDLNGLVIESGNLND